MIAQQTFAPSTCWPALLLCCTLSAQAAETFGPFNYRCFDSATAAGCTVAQQSPFVGMSFAYFYFEDFEDGSFDSPGITPQQGGILQNFGAFQDSVDEDDGVVDGVNLSSNASFGQTGGAVTITLDFSAAALGGRLPTHVGLALVNNFNNFALRAFDSDGNQVDEVLGTTVFVGNGSALDDNFMGIAHDGGIASISVTGGGGGMELDHIQFGLGCSDDVTADEDLDGIADAADNCLTIPNSDQRDSNGDGFGNACDADLNNDGATNSIDLGLMKSVFFGIDADADLNGDGIVNPIDLGVFRQLFFAPPGPACSAPSRATS